MTKKAKFRAKIEMIVALILGVGGLVTFFIGDAVVVNIWVAILGTVMLGAGIILGSVSKRRTDEPDWG